MIICYLPIIDCYRQYTIIIHDNIYIYIDMCVCIIAPTAAGALTLSPHGALGLQGLFLLITGMNSIYIHDVVKKNEYN